MMRQAIFMLVISPRNMTNDHSTNCNDKLIMFSQHSYSLYSIDPFYHKHLKAANNRVIILQYNRRRRDDQYISQLPIDFKFLITMYNLFL